MTTSKRSGDKVVFCAGCPQRGAFYAITKALGRQQEAIFSGDIGCLRLGNNATLNAVDTDLDPDSIIPIEKAAEAYDPKKKNIIFVSDTTFFTSAKDIIVDAVKGRRDFTIVVLNNDLASVMGVLPDQHANNAHVEEGTAKDSHTTDASQASAASMDMSSVLRDELISLGVNKITKANPLFADKAIDAARDALKYKGPSAVIFESSCTRLSKKKPPVYFIANACAGCRKCVTTIGCPALGWSEVGHTIVIDRDQCSGCGLCTDICEYGVITCPTRPRIRPVLPPRSTRLPSDDGSLSRFPTASELS